MSAPGDNIISSHTLFISDLHLDPNEPKVTDAFCRFLTHQASEADALYILGDFFEAWVGDDDLTEYHQHIIHTLRQFTRQNIPVYFMHGNRDFLIGKKFVKMTGVQLIPDPTLIQLYGKPILLLHGDSLCILDSKHQKSRRIMHNKLCQKAVLLLPLSYRRKVGRRIRERSYQRNQNIADNIMDVADIEVTRVMTANKTQLMIHGHTHRPAIHELTIANQPAQRIVLGAWHQGGTILKYKSNGEHQLEAVPL